MKTIIVVMGVSGSGKTTVAAMLAGALGARFLEGDDVHPRANVEKMKSGTPLTDADRLPWLQSIARELREETGLRAERWHKLLECDLSNSVSDERAMVFLAWDLSQGEASPEPSEELVVRKVPLKEAFRMADAGEIRDAISLLALQAVERLLLKGKLLGLLGPGASDWI